MHKSWIQILKTKYDMMEDEIAKELKVRKMIRKLLERADKNCPPIEFETYKLAHFFKYLLALQNLEKIWSLYLQCTLFSTASFIHTIW